MNTNNTHNTCNIYRVGCSDPQGPWQKEYLVRNSLLGIYLGSSISGAIEGIEKSRKERIKLQSLKMECLQVKLSRIHNLGLIFKNQRLASRSHSHPSTMSPGIFMNTLWNISAYIIWIVVEELMSFQGILCHLGGCGWAENRHFWRKALRLLLHCPAPDPSVGQSKNSKVLVLEYQSWKCFDSTSERETTPPSGAAHSQSPICIWVCAHLPLQPSITVSLRAQ